MMKWPEIKYIEAEDGMLDPVLNWPKQPEGSIGKYGSMRLDYLKNHRRVLYSQMVLKGTLKRHLMDVNRQAHEMLDQIIGQMKVVEGITEDLKARNPLVWVQRMNSIKFRAEKDCENNQDVGLEAATRSKSA